MKIPRFVLAWARKEDIPRDDITMEIQTHPDWSTVSEEIVDEEKYNNVSELILEHAESGRFVRVMTNSLPYGITDYGMAPEDEDIEEVFPVQVLVTKYLTKAEQKAQPPFTPTP